MTADLQGRSVIVVGASSGIGRAVATALTGANAKVGWCARREDLLHEGIAAAGGGGIALPADISSESDCRALAERVSDSFDMVDLVVIASGTSGVSMLADTDADYWDRILRTNVVGPSLFVRHLLSLLAPGAIVAMLSSESVGSPYPGLVPYAVSKAALEESIRGWRAEHPEFRFSQVTVGATDGTDIIRDFDPELSTALFPRWIASGVIPAQVMHAFEVGAMIAHTLSQAVITPGVDVHTITIRPPGGPYIPGEA